MSLDSDQIEMTPKEIDTNNNNNNNNNNHDDDELNSESLPHDQKSKMVRSGSTIIKLKIIKPKPPKSQQQQKHKEEQGDVDVDDDDDDIEEEEEVESISKESSSDSIDSYDLDQQSSEELHKIYEIYQNRFKSSIKKSNKLFESLQNQTFTLSYYYRRNQSLLTVLDELEQHEEEGEEQEQGEQFDFEDDLMKRMEKIIEKMPRCKNSLIPFNKLFKNFKINKNELIDLYLIEKIPDLINDDLIKLQTNPQNIENWCIRNNPNLINLNYKPITIDNLQDYNNGTEYLLNLNDEFLSNQSSSNRKKRKIDKK